MLFLLRSVLSRRRRSSLLRRPGDGLAERLLPRSRSRRPCCCCWRRRWRWWWYGDPVLTGDAVVGMTSGGRRDLSPQGGIRAKKNTLCVPGTKTRHIPMSAILECGRLTPQTDPPFNLDSPGWRRKADEFYTHTHKLARIRIVRGEQNARLIINLNILLRSSGQISLRVARRRENAAALGDDELAGRYDPCSSSVFFLFLRISLFVFLAILACTSRRL